MRSSTTRLIIFAATILVSVIVAFQLHWLNKTYSFEKNEFNTSVVKAIRGLYEDLDLDDKPGFQFHNLIERPNENSFVFKIDNIPPKDSLVKALIVELDDFRIYTGCNAAVYDSKQQAYAYQEYISNAASSKSVSVNTTEPVVKTTYDYISLYFPARQQYILSNMGGWIFTSILLLVLFIAFGASIYYLYRQKSLNDIQKDFINNVTHEFSTPLTVIDLSTDALAKPTVMANEERFNKYLEAIKYQTDYLKKHIQTLVSTVVTDSYRTTINKTNVCPNDLIRKALAQLDPIFIQKNGKLLLNLEENNEVIAADEDNLYLAIFNIINNAIKYSEVPRIQISSKVSQGKYHISTKDNGIGISATDLKKIFNKFFRAGSGNVHNSRGLGLGLYFSRKIIDLHHGEIEVNSVEDVGTEFKIILPIN